MKIACISASQTPSTAANSMQVMKACQALAQSGHQVYLFVPGSTRTSWAELAAFYGLQAPFEVEWLPVNPHLKRYDFCLFAVRRARRLGADLLYIWPLQAAVFGLLGRKPVLLEIHGPPEGRIGPWFFRLFLALPGQKRLLPITRALASILERQYHVHFSPHEVIISPNGIDLERYRNLSSPLEARRLLGLPECFTAGYTGHLYPGRGMSLLMELAQRFPGVQFLWVGGRAEDVAAWRDRLIAAKIENVKLTGFIENQRLPMYQVAADILLMPYERQITGSSGGNSADYCSPMKMFEYMGCGRPIISSDLPVIREVLNERNALLCPPEQVESWVQAVHSLASQPGLRAALGSQALRDAQLYTWLGRAQRALAGFMTSEVKARLD